MENARIFKLQGPVTVSSSFEEAFGEYSEARGGGRARRKARRLERIQNRQEVRSARAQARIQNRAERQSARQQKRTANMEMRQQRRTSRKQFKDERRNKGEDELLDGEQPQDGSVTDTGEGSGGSALPPLYNPNGQGGGGGVAYGDEQPMDYGGEPMGESETTEESDIEAGEDYAGGEDEEESSADGINYEDLGSTDDLLTLESDDFYSYMDDYASADGTPAMVRARINPNIKSVAIKSQWNKEKASRLRDKINEVQSILDSGNLRSNYDIGKYAKLLADLKEKYTLAIDRAQGFDGLLSNYCTSDDGSSNASGKRSTKKQKKAEVKAAKREAKKERVKAIKKNKLGKRLSRKGIQGDSVIPVDEQLSPEFDSQRIVVPAAELSTGANGKTGLIALDACNDIDAPNERVIDIKLGADGDYSNASGKKTNWTGIVVGVAIAGFAIWYGRKQKWF